MILDVRSDKDLLSYFFANFEINNKACENPMRANCVLFNEVLEYALVYSKSVATIEAILGKFPIGGYPVVSKNMQALCNWAIKSENPDFLGRLERVASKDEMEYIEGLRSSSAAASAGILPWPNPPRIIADDSSDDSSDDELDDNPSQIRVYNTAFVTNRMIYDYPADYFRQTGDGAIPYWMKLSQAVAVSKLSCVEDALGMAGISEDDKKQILNDDWVFGRYALTAIQNGDLEILNRIISARKFYRPNAGEEVEQMPFSPPRDTNRASYEENFFSAFKASLKKPEFLQAFSSLLPRGKGGLGIDRKRLIFGCIDDVAKLPLDGIKLVMAIADEEDREELFYALRDKVVSVEAVANDDKINHRRREKYFATNYRGGEEEEIVAGFCERAMGGVKFFAHKIDNGRDFVESENYRSVSAPMATPSAIVSRNMGLGKQDYFVMGSELRKALAVRKSAEESLAKEPSPASSSLLSPSGKALSVRLQSKERE